MKPSFVEGKRSAFVKTVEAKLVLLFVYTVKATVVGKIANICQCNT